VFDSRAMAVMMDGELVPNVVPWADMLNHHERANVMARRFDADRQVCDGVMV
jgi:hypothetical protein